MGLKLMGIGALSRESATDLEGWMAYSAEIRLNGA
jgi:hypothetical protein